MRYRLVIVMLLFAVQAAAQETVTTIVPVVGNIPGINAVRWLTDVEITNSGAFDADVAIELPAVADAPVFVFALAPGQSQRFTDIVGQAFGIPTALSPLRITTAGNRTVRVRASAYAVKAEGVSVMQPLGVYAENTWFPLRVLDGLAFSDAFRTNIGVVNFGDQPADVLFALQKIPGRNVAVSPMRIPAGAVFHVPIQFIFPLISEGSGFSVLVETAARDTHVYASVVENATSTGHFVVPRIGIR
jgi:hypothetical protein